MSCFLIRCLVSESVQQKSQEVHQDESSDDTCDKENTAEIEEDDFGSESEDEVGEAPSRSQKRKKSKVLKEMHDSMIISILI